MAGVLTPGDRVVADPFRHEHLPLVQPYLFFAGRCDEASPSTAAIGGPWTFLMRYKGELRLDATRHSPRPGFEDRKGHA